MGREEKRGHRVNRVHLAWAADLGTKDPRGLLDLWAHLAHLDCLDHLVKVDLLATLERGVSGVEMDPLE